VVATVFALLLIPSSLLENIVVQKTYTADRPGEFGGGDVQITTKDFPGKRMLQVSLGAGYDAASLIRFLKPLLMEQNPLDRERLYAQMWARNRNTTYRCIGAVDVALSVMRNTDWEPSLALADGRSHLPRRRMHGWPGLRMGFAPRVFDSRHEDAMAKQGGPRGIVTLVCLTCGKEKFFTREVPAAVSCDQCGSTVFRTFATPTEPDEAAIDALEAQARSMAYGDSSPDTTRDDVRDLGM